MDPSFRPKPPARSQGDEQDPRNEFHLPRQESTPWEEDEPHVLTSGPTPGSLRRRGPWSPVDRPRTRCREVLPASGSAVQAERE